MSENKRESIAICTVCKRGIPDFAEPNPTDCPKCNGKNTVIHSSEYGHYCMADCDYRTPREEGFTQEQAKVMLEFIKKTSHLFWAVQDTELKKESQLYEAGKHEEYDGSKAWEVACAVITDDAASLVKKIDEDES